MKKNSFIPLVLLILAAALIGCSSAPQATPTPAASSQSLPAVVSASGKVLPTRWANLSFQAGGPIVELKGQTGDQLKAGEVIARLDDTDARLAVAQAEAALAVSQAQLAQLKAGPRAEQIAVAEQAVKAAQAQLMNASAQLAQLQLGARPAEVAAAEAEVAKAASDLKFAQQAYDGVVEGRATAKAYGIRGGGLGLYEEQMRAQLQAIQAAFNVAQKRLDQVKSGATKNELNATRANVAAAQAQRDSAQAQLDLLKAGSTLEQIGVAEANVKQAQAALDTANAQLAKTQIVAPFDGTIGAVAARQGEMAAPGQAIVTIGDLGSLRVETTDLSEADVARAREGQPVRLTFDALPGKTLNGKVVRIAPMSTPGQSAVNYVVTVSLDELDPALRWGMTAFVDVQVSE